MAGYSPPAMQGEAISCPFCAFTVPSGEKLHTWQLMQHVELSHSENDDSPFRIREASQSPVSRPMVLQRSHSSFHNSNNTRPPSTRHSPSPAGGHRRSRSNTPSGYGGEDEGDYYVECPLEDCGEAVHIRELGHHMELHDSESMASSVSSEPDLQPLQGLPSVAAGLSPQQQQQQQQHPYSRSSSSRGSSRASFEGRRGRSPSPSHLLPPPLAAVRPSSPQQYPRKSPSPNFLAVPYAKSSPYPSTSTSTSRPPPARGLKSLFLGPAPRKTRSSKKPTALGTVRRLGKSELGPHAFEEHMPAWLRTQLECGPKISWSNAIGQRGNLVKVERAANETSGIIPVLAQLCQQDHSLSKVFLCHPSVRHVFKQSGEGGFCGYRNIQMVVSFVQETRFPGCESFPGMRTPGILALQDMIEGAWDEGFNSQGRVETGGIRGTRKYIGTPEAQALFCSLGIGCEADAFNKPASADGREGEKYVHDAVLESLFGYFSTGVTDPSQKVYQTGLAPVYFQHPGHSLTVVGLEVRKSGLMNLLVFDPMFKTSPPVAKLVGSSFRSDAPGRLLKAFRRGNSYLSKYNSFEILKLTAPRAHGGYSGRARADDFEPFDEGGDGL